MLKKEMEKRIAELEAMLRAKDDEIQLLEYNSRKTSNVTIAVEVFIETNFPMIKKNDKDEWNNIIETVENPTDRNYLMMKYLLKLLND
ncbi:MAG: hypothetical protein GY829_03395 [Gammaproteobacteria bacterium]|nr:hypothetical protein [Gammaproteobacteria bacterium]